MSGSFTHFKKFDYVIISKRKKKKIEKKKKLVLLLFLFYFLVPFSYFAYIQIG